MLSMDANHITCVYFLITAAKLLKIDLKNTTTQTTIDYLLTLKLGCGYFTGGYNAVEMPSLANTYTALCVLMQVCQGREQFEAMVDL